MECQTPKDEALGFCCYASFVLYAQLCVPYGSVLVEYDLIVPARYFLYADGDLLLVSLLGRCARDATVGGLDKGVVAGFPQDPWVIAARVQHKRIWVVTIIVLVCWLHSSVAAVHGEKG